MIDFRTGRAACTILALFVFTVVPASGQSRPDVEVQNPSNLTSQSTPASSSNKALAAGVESSMVGIILNERELPGVALAVLNVDQSERALVSIKGFAEALGLSWKMQASAENSVLQTPIGAAEIPNAALLVVDGEAYLPITVLAQKLASQIEFDSGEFALRCEVPWRLQNGRAARKSALVPDVFAPNLSLSRTRTSVSGSRTNGRTSASLDQQFAGILGPGIWNTQFSRGLLDGPSDTRLESLWWLYERGQHRSLLGFDRVNLNLLLSSFRLSGLQYAYTNNPTQVYQTQRGYSGQLVASAGQASNTLQGEGPAGGTAELRVSGMVLQRQIIGLDGQWLFNNVPTGSGQGVDIEVALYEFARPGLPVRVEQFLSQASAYQLAKGTYFHYLGFGELGELFQSDRRQQGGLMASRGDLEQGSGAFYQSRYGLSDRITVEVATQSLNGVRQNLVGSAFNLGRLGSWASYLAQGTDSARAYQIFGDGEYRNFRWRADIIDREAGFQGPEDRATSAQRAEVLYEPNVRLELGLVYGRIDNELKRRFSFLKPSLRYSPYDQLTFRAKPSFDGYSFDIDWIISERARFGIGRFGDQTQAELQYKLNETHRVRLLTIESRESTQNFLTQVQDSQRRTALILDSNWGGRGRTVTSVGVVGGSERTGYLAELSHELLPGLDARVRVERDGLFGASPDLLMQFFVVGDFAVSGTRLLPNYGASSILGSEGSIAGALSVDSANIVDDLDLGQLPILIDGQIRGYTMPGGKFSMDDLAPGVYRVEMDGEGLPIEVAVTNPARNVQVRRGGVTDLTFDLEILLGFAGKAVLPGVSDLASLRVEVIDASGALVNTTTLNRFGYYRVENLKPGRYRLRLLDKTGAVLAMRSTVNLVDTFLFGQNF